jgi:drug/metabolite transporter (DMT)-like permease
MWKLFGRVSSGFTADCCLFIAFGFTNMSKAYCIFFTNNLMLPFCGRLFLKEPIKMWDIVGLTFGFGGMMLLVQPWVTASDAEQEAEMKNDMLGCIIAFVAAVCAALSLTVGKTLSTDNRISWKIIPFYYMVGSSLFAPLWSLLVPPVTSVEQIPHYDYGLYLLMIGAGFCAML